MGGAAPRRRRAEGSAHTAARAPRRSRDPRRGLGFRRAGSGGGRRVVRGEGGGRGTVGLGLLFLSYYCRLALLLSLFKLYFNFSPSLSPAAPIAFPSLPQLLYLLPEFLLLGLVFPPFYFWLLLLR